MVEQILPNNNEKCYSNFSPKFSQLNTARGQLDIWFCLRMPTRHVPPFLARHADMSSAWAVGSSRWPSQSSDRWPSLCPCSRTAHRVDQSVDQPRAQAAVPFPRRTHLAVWAPGPAALLLWRHHRRHQPWALRFWHAAAQPDRCSWLRSVSQVSRRLPDSDTPRPRFLERTMSCGGCRFCAACAVAEVD
jgi:hypothetical protein